MMINKKGGVKLENIVIELCAWRTHKIILRNAGNGP